MILFFEILIIIILVFVNGIFAAAEIAVVTIRGTRIKEMIIKKIPFAKRLERLKSNIEQFFVTIQLGITLIGTLASVIAGTISVKYLTPFLSKNLGFLSNYSEPISVGITTAVVSFMFLFFGELIPKSIAARRPDGVALISASFLDIFSRLVRPFIFIVYLPHQLFIRFFVRQKVYSENRISEDEIRLIIEEGVSCGVVEKQEQELIEKIFGFTDRRAEDIMIAISDADLINITSSKDEIVEQIIRSGHSRFPVYANERENIVGIITARDFYYVYFQSEIFILQDIIREPLFISRNMKISQLLREMQRRKTHMAVVVREDKRTAGIITLEDILEEIVGEIEDERYNG